MKTSSELLKNLDKRYFWDIDVALLDPEKSKQIIIERVFSLGDIDEINTVITYYGEDVTLNVLRNLNYLDPKTLNLVSKLFNEPREKFRCHKRKLSIPQHWNS